MTDKVETVLVSFHRVSRLLLDRLILVGSRGALVYAAAAAGFDPQTTDQCECKLSVFVIFIFILSFETGWLLWKRSISNHGISTLVPNTTYNTVVANRHYCRFVWDYYEAVNQSKWPLMTYSN